MSARACLGTAYVTANQVPNLVYELVLGGALTSAMVPVLARSAERAADDPQEKARVSQISSALLTWSVIILLPLTIVVAAAAGPIADLLNPANAHAHCVRADVVAVTSRMLVVFAPQIILSGLSVVLYGLLQAYRRFAGPALGPAISSLVVISAYLAFAPADKDLPLARLPLTAELILSVGTTLGVAALLAVAVLPTWRLHLTFRPRLRFPPGVARRAGGLALIGVFEIVAYDLSIVVALVLANGRGSTGAVVLLNYGWQVFNSVNGVLALSVAVSAFPVLSAREGLVFDRTCAGSTRAVLLVSWLGAAVTAAIAVPGRPRPGQAAGTGAGADRRARPVRPGPGRVRRHREHVAGDDGPRAAQGRGRGGGRQLARGDRGRRGAGRARAAPPRGGRAGPGQHHRPDRGGRPAGARGPADPRAGSRPGHGPGGAGRGGGRGRPARWPAWPSAWRCRPATSCWPAGWPSSRPPARPSRSAWSPTS